jgi:hypothetical protein
VLSRSRREGNGTGEIHRLDLGLPIERDLVVIVDGGELLLGDIDSGLGDKVDLAITKRFGKLELETRMARKRERGKTDLSLLKEIVEAVDGLVKPGGFNLALSERESAEERAREG